ncbi:hypothetical protein M405DRAFT_815904, partial [Rhizopogon salebrosus TDB-379]
MTNGITPPSGLDRHCASSSSSQFLPPCTSRSSLSSFCFSPLPSSFSSASSARSCNIMDSGHGEAWKPEGRLRLWCFHARLDADLVDETGLDLTHLFQRAR